MEKNKAFRIEQMTKYNLNEVNKLRTFKNELKDKEQQLALSSKKKKEGDYEEEGRNKRFGILNEDLDWTLVSPKMLCSKSKDPKFKNCIIHDEVRVL